MKDAEFLFNQTAKERKRIGRGDYNKKRQGGKTVRFPSDYLTKKERDSMSGECKTYDMAKPVGWAAFKQWPEDLQRAYLLGLREKFNVIDSEIAEMFGVTQKTVSNLKARLGISNGKYKRKFKRADEWKEFLLSDGRQIVKVVEPVEAKSETETEKPQIAEVQTEAKATEFPVGEQKFIKLALGLDANASKAERILSIAMLLESLSGTGAKLTLEVNL